MYQIQFDYVTGDSFGSREKTERLDMTWRELSTAQENLKRIEEHYRAYTKDHNRATEKQWAAANGKERWFVPKYDFSLVLLADGGEPFQLSAPWCGYFERLISAEIVAVSPELGKVVF